ncbi:MAG: helix-turn-helix domain-containing protein [Myxococcota bacterium]
MDRTRFTTSPCSIARSLDVLGDWWTPLIIREAMYGVHRFDEFQFNLNIARNILTRRLKLLVEQGVMEKRPIEGSRRKGYHLTDKGYDAAKVLMALRSFGERWTFDGEQPILLYSRTTGKRVEPVLVDRETGEPVDVRDLYAGPGPAFPKSEKAKRYRFREYYERAEGAE